MKESTFAANMLKAMLVTILFPFVFFTILFSVYYWQANKDAESLDLKKISRYYHLLEVPDDEGNEPFNKHNWLHGTEQEQTREVKKLVKQGLLKDKTKQEIRETLEAKPLESHININSNTVRYFFNNGGGSFFQVRTS